MQREYRATAMDYCDTRRRLGLRVPHARSRVPSSIAAGWTVVANADIGPPLHEDWEFLAKYGDSLFRVSDRAEVCGKKVPLPLRIEFTGRRDF